jgi:hypothetical protein
MEFTDEELRRFQVVVFAAHVDGRRQRFTFRYKSDFDQVWPELSNRGWRIVSKD